MGIPEGGGEEPVLDVNPGAEGNGGEDLIVKLFRSALRLEASDLHLKEGQPPMVRHEGMVKALKGDPLSADFMRHVVDTLCSEDHQEELSNTGGTDLAYALKEGARFRVNIFRQRGRLSLAARRVEANIPGFKELHLPEKQLKEIAMLQQGLVLVCGITGSGKSTTLATVIDYINTNARKHIVTIEDPIEYLFTDNKSIINQREIGIDVADFHTALRHVVRQDPDIILIGEMRDATSVSTALTAAETGHLVFGTLHTLNAASTVGRMLDLFEEDRQGLIRQGLQFNLQGIISQKLLPSCLEGVQRVPACEILRANSTVRRLIGEKQDLKLFEAIRAGKADGMQDFTESLRQLVTNHWITREVAMENAPNPSALDAALKGISIQDSGMF